MFKKRELITFSSGIGAEYTGCGQGPNSVTNSVYFKTLQTRAKNKFVCNKQFYAASQLQYTNAVPEICRINHELAREVSCLVKNNKFFTVLGGDHSCGIGTWSGASNSSATPLGLLWIDAHLDAHTIKSSPR